MDYTKDQYNKDQADRKQNIHCNEVKDKVFLPNLMSTDLVLLCRTLQAFMQELRYLKVQSQKEDKFTCSRILCWTYTFSCWSLENATMKPPKSPDKTPVSFDHALQSSSKRKSFAWFLQPKKNKTGATSSPVLAITSRSSIKARNGAQPVPGPTRINGIAGLGSVIAPFVNHIGTNTFPFFGLSEANHEEHRPILFLLNVVTQSTTATAMCASFGCASWEDAMEYERGCRRGTVCNSHSKGSCRGKDNPSFSDHEAASKWLLTQLLKFVILN